MSTLLKRQRYPSRRRLAMWHEMFAIGACLIVAGVVFFLIVVSAEAYYGWQ